MITGLEGRGDYVKTHPVVFTYFMHGCVGDMDLHVPHRPPMDAPIQQVEGVHVPKEAEDAVTEGVASEMHIDVQSYHPGSPICSTAGNVLDVEFNFFGLNDLYDKKELNLDKVIE